MDLPVNQGTMNAMVFTSIQKLFLLAPLLLVCSPQFYQLSILLSVLGPLPHCSPHQAHPVQVSLRFWMCSSFVWYLEECALKDFWDTIFSSRNFWKLSIMSVNETRKLKSSIFLLYFGKGMHVSHDSLLLNTFSWGLAVVFPPVD